MGILPFELVHFSGNTYTTKIHDSLKISNGKWMWWSRGIEICVVPKGESEGGADFSEDSHIDNLSEFPV